jgi:hypothetical protein
MARSDPDTRQSGLEFFPVFHDYGSLSRPICWGTDIKSEPFLKIV